MNKERQRFSLSEAKEILGEDYFTQRIRRNSYEKEIVDQLYGNLAVPSYVHGYSLAIEYARDWFQKRFPKNYFVGGIYIDGKHVLDDYKRLNDYNQKNIVKGQNPRARIEPSLEFDYDREGVDLYQAPPEIFLKRSKMQDSFFKDYDNCLFLGMNMRAMRMNFNYKVRVNTKSQQLDIANRMELYFRVGATQAEDVSVDFHVPKHVMIFIAKQAAFEVDDNQNVVDPISFVEYLNAHSDLPFLFKLRAINQHPEYFIRIPNLYCHTAVKDKLQIDSGERDGKLDSNFHVEMNSVLTMPIPHFYTLYTAVDPMENFPIKREEDEIAIYSINIFDIPKVDEHGWTQAAFTEYITDKGDTEMDLSSLFTGDNVLAKTVEHDLVLGVSPYHFINIKVYRDDDKYKELKIDMNWETKVATFVDGPMDEEHLQIAIYYDRKYMNELTISTKSLQLNNRLAAKEIPTYQNDPLLPNAQKHL